MNTPADRHVAQMDELLRRAADNFPFPATPALVPAVMATIERGPAGARPPLGRWLSSPRLSLAAAFVAVIAGLLAALTVPGSRSAIADFFHLSRITIKQDQGGSPTPPVLAPGNFARPSTIDELNGRLGFALRLPSVDGKTLQPDAVYLQAEEITTPIAILAYRDAGFDLYETRAAYIEKLVRGEAAVHRVIVRGHDAYWVEQGGHIVQSVDSSGRVVIESRRTVDRATLIWEEDGITYRIESSLSQDETVAVAESLR